ncbi:MAG: response regulator transcription factor [Sinobacteraceae bacterium]|nr:response regulator transcription factor [Nevskiaceae bacterium]MBV9316860.1 response regulator transcription factor [Gammaproteobacteria bacterium]
MKALVIDDEALARRELRRLLAEFPWLEVVGEAANIEEAVAKIEALSPELLFLDIKMPGGSGFDLLARLERVPKVIFTTAHDQHAVRAFEVNALDYLLKPVEPERLAAAVRKARDSSSPGTPQGGVLEQLFVQDGPRCWFVPLREVRLLSAENNYVRLWWGKLQPLIARPLSTIERRLDPKKFFRANRSQIINLEFIEKVDLGINGRLDVTLRTGGPQVEISRRQARLFREQMSI